MRHKNAITMGHISQILCGCVGYILTSGIFTINYNVLSTSVLLIGMSRSTSTDQVQIKRMSGNDETVADALLSRYATMKLASKLLGYFISPFIYNKFGYNIFSIYCLMIGIIYLFCILIMDNITQITKISNKTVIIHETKGDFTSIPTNQFLWSPTVITSILCVSVNYACRFWFDLSTAILFVEDFNMNSQFVGYLKIISVIMAIGAAQFNVHVRSRWNTFEYPYDFLLYVCIFSVGCLAFIVLPPDIIVGIIFLPLCYMASATFESIEITSRRYICPSFTFKQISSYVQVISSGTT
eukprot:95236_1